jgi:hypothetical protein
VVSGFRWLEALMLERNTNTIMSTKGMKGKGEKTEMAAMAIDR